jgi:hypothetical protein
MTSDLVHRMRTCAAALMRCDDVSALHKDAADLLAEASNLLDEPDDLGEPMEILEPVAIAGTAPQLTAGAMWGSGDLPTMPVDYGAIAKPCPYCGSVDIRKVSIANRRLKLTCPRCSQQWEYAR